MLKNTKNMTPKWGSVRSADFLPYAILKDDDNNDDYATDEDNIGDNVDNVAKCKVWQSPRSQE